MYGIKEVLKRDLDGTKGIRSKNKDRVVVITGYEGTGKSNLALNLFEEWYKLLGWKVTEDDIQWIASNQKEFVQGLESCKQYGMFIHDEAGKDLYARNSISSFNKDLNIAYQVIRARNLYTVLVIPSVNDLDTFFKRRRVTAMLHVYAEGKFVYYSKAKIREIIPAMIRGAQYSADPDPTKLKDARGNYIQANFSDTFPLYKGILKQPYEERKKANMQNVLQELKDKYSEEGNSEKKERIEKLYAIFRTKYLQGLPRGKIRQELKLDLKQANEFIHRIHDEDVLPVLSNND